MARYKIGDRIQLVVSRNSEPNFDRACESAYKMALMRFGCDDDGHLRDVENSQRSRDAIIVQFERYRYYGTVVGQTSEYVFQAWVQSAGDPSPPIQDVVQ